MPETDKPPSASVVPPTVPIPNINVPDPTVGKKSEDQGANDSATGHEAFEKAKADTEGRR